MEQQQGKKILKSHADRQRFLAGSIVVFCLTLGGGVSVLSLLTRQNTPGILLMSTGSRLSMPQGVFHTLLIWIAALSAGAIMGLLIFLVAAISIVHALTHPQRKTQFIPLSSFMLDLPGEEVQFPPLFGNHRVRGLYVPYKGASTTIIVSPGYRRTLTDVLGVCKHLWQAGHSVLALEYWGHGKVVGVPVTLGYREVNDFLGAVEYAKKRAPQTRLGALGYSMGGAISIMGAARAHDVEAVVADSAFATHWGVVETALRRTLRFIPHIPTWVLRLLYHLADRILGWRAGYHFHQVSPLREISHLAPRPVLLIHGLEDTIVPSEDARSLYQAAMKPKALWLIPGTEHTQGYFTDSQAYVERITVFFDRFLRQRARPSLSPEHARSQPHPQERKDLTQTQSQPGPLVLPSERSALLPPTQKKQSSQLQGIRSSRASRVFAVFTGYPKAYWFLLLGTLINGTATFVLPFESLYLVSQRHFMVDQAAAIVALYGIGSCLSALLGGILADKIGRRPTILSGLLCLAATTFGLAFAQDARLIAVLTFLMGFWISWYRPASNAVLADLLPQERQAQANGLIYWAYNLGMAVSPLLASMLVPAIGYTILFCADGIGTMLFCLLIFLGLPETRPAEARPARSLPDHVPQETRQRGVWRDGRFLLFTGLSFLLTSVYFQSISTLPADMQAHGLDAIHYGLAISVNGLVVILLSLPLSNLLARMAPFKGLAMSAVLLGAGFGLTALADRLLAFPVYAGSVLVWTLGEILFVPVTATIVALLSPPPQRGLYQGVSRTSWGLSAFAGPLVGGMILQAWGSRLWIGCAVLGALLAGSFLLLGRKQSAPAPAPQKTKGTKEQLARAQEQMIAQVLLSLFTQILEIPQAEVTLTSNFFELGGDSDSLEMLLSEIQQCLHVSLLPGNLFENPVVFRLAAVIAREQQRQRPRTSKEPVRVNE